MIDFKKIGLYVLVTLFGFFTISFNFLLGVQSGVFEDLSAAQIVAVRDTLFYNTSLIWLVCAVFGLAYFFVPGRAGLAFLLSAFFVPLLYGLSVLFF